MQIEEYKLQPVFDSDCSLTVMNYATLSTTPSTDLRFIKYLKTPNYIS